MGFNKFKKNKKKVEETKTRVKKTQMTRKEARKEQRRAKKAKKTEYFLNRKNRNHFQKEGVPKNDRSKGFQNEGMLSQPDKKIVKKVEDNKTVSIVESIERERKKDMQLKKDMMRQRKRHLLQANLEEDKNIKRLEKQLNLNKRKSKTIPKSFIASGLDYILDVCDRDKLESAANAEKNLYESGSEFEDDLAMVTGKKKVKKSVAKKRKLDKNVEDNIRDDGGSNSDADNDMFDELESEGSDVDTDEMSQGALSDDAMSDDDHSDQEEFSKEKGGTGPKKVKFGNSSAKVISEDELNDFSGSESETGEDDTSVKSEDTVSPDKEAEDIWEDIYGRKRDRQGNIIKETTQKYVPPKLRENSGADADKKKEELLRLKKNMKGLINRLAENNMHSIANQIEDLYMRNSRNDMNETLFQLYFESIVSNVATPERLVMEHAMLIAILHANVGTEVGSHILLNLVKKFDELVSSEQPIENKQLDNIILLIVHLYTFKIFSCTLIYDILGRLCDRFGEKEIELIILIFRSVGFVLRKDSPVALKELIMRTQKLANEATTLKDSPRVKFMLEVLLTIKNNNMSKLPQYDPSHGEHLKKIIKTMIRSGNYVTELKISLEDLLKADERGRWWVVGSAWNCDQVSSKHQSEPSQISSTLGCQVTQEILELAKRQRMNTANRRNIFCILMTAEDYLDAFEKLLKLGLKGQPEQEIVYVLMDCLLQETEYNPYYSFIASQLCMSNRRHQMTIQCSVWDKIKDIDHLSDHQITNLAKFLSHLFLNKSLPISVLKVMQFADMEKKSVRLLRQVLLSILMCKEGEEEMLAVFSRVARSKKLDTFREALRLFLHHFMLRNLNKEDDSLTDMQALSSRIKLVDQALASGSKLI